MLKVSAAIYARGGQLQQQRWPWQFSSEYPPPFLAAPCASPPLPPADAPRPFHFPFLFIFLLAFHHLDTTVNIGTTKTHTIRGTFRLCIVSAPPIPHSPLLFNGSSPMCFLASLSLPPQRCSFIMVSKPTDLLPVPQRKNPRQRLSTRSSRVRRKPTALYPAR